MNTTSASSDPYDPHPRQLPAHLSVSLRHEKQHLSQTQEQAEMFSQGSHIHTGGRGLSDSSYDTEGSIGGDDAQVWFHRSNRHLETGMHFGDIDEPPYFLPHVSSSGSTEVSRKASIFRPKLGNSNNLRAPSSGNGSGVDDFRSVIDDLTIENKRLKERLKSLEGRSSVDLEEDKLFELKIHSLPSHNRRELEDTLRAFISGLHEPLQTGDRLRSSISISGASPYTPDDVATRITGKHASSSSSTTDSCPLDSAYASMSQSGPTSSSNLHHVTLEGKSTPHQRIQEGQKVQSFLHDIPQGVFPRHSVMTDHQKKKLVVLRLEQLFTGKKGVIGGEHSQPVQQQEVSDSAAKADRDADKGQAQTEGVREAKIYHLGPHMSRPGKWQDEDSREVQIEASYSSDEVPADQSSLEQRPTRPLDLDLNRAQIPADNAEYLRHLGLSTPNLAYHDSKDSAADDDGWIYLNLLINMAQLHIINVTQEFVRAAVSEVSEKFQISLDGKKLRWRGGSKGTQLSSESGNSSARTQSPQDSDNPDQNRKRRKVNTGRFVSVLVDIPDPSSNGIDISQYKPLFYHQSSDSSVEGSSEGGSLLGYDQKSLGGTEAVPPTPEIWTTNPESKASKKRRRGDGPIVFYNGANFFTDLSGDPTITSSETRTVGSDSIQALRSPRLGPSRTISDSTLSERPFEGIVARSGSAELVDAEFEEENDYFNELSVNAPCVTAPFQKFEASGLGGTQPADHFALRVNTRRRRFNVPIPTNLSRFSTPSVNVKKFAHSIPNYSLLAFHQEDTQDVQEVLTQHLASTTTPDFPSPSFQASKISQCLPFTTEILSAQFFRLEPSSLPPPMGYYATSTSSDDDFSDDDSTSEITSNLQHNRLPERRQIGSFESVDTGMEGEEGDDVYGESDESIDMLGEA